jgi:hypothetical protein
VGSSRSIDGNSERAYRVVEVVKGNTNYYGPYSTLGAAKGKRTTETKINRRYYGSEFEIWVEQTPEGWEKVEV